MWANNSADRVSLHWRKDQKNSWFQASDFKTWEPVETDLAGVNFLTSLGKLDDRTYFSQNRNCKQNVLLTSSADEQSSKLTFRAIPGKKSTYSIQNMSGCDRTFLSATNNCYNKVDYWTRDDGNGNQHWIIQPVEGKEGAYYLRHAGKPSRCPRKYLNTQDRWNTADLYSDYVNDNQWWAITPFKPAEPLELPALAQIISLGKTDNRIELAADLKCNDENAYLDERVQFKREHGWKFVPVPGKLNTFNIVSNRNCEKKFLSVNGSCGKTYVDLWFKDNGNGLQQWYIKKVEGKENAYTFTVGGRLCPKIFLSTRKTWDRVDLWSSKNQDVQHFDIQKYDPYTPEDTNLEGFNVIKSVGRTDGNSFAMQTRSCGIKVGFESTRDNQVAKFQFRPVAGKKSVYSIQNTSGCSRTFLSANSGCDSALDYWVRDDNNGNQHFLVQPVIGKENTYTIRHIGKKIECKKFMMSTRKNWQGTDLQPVNSAINQEWEIE